MYVIIITYILPLICFNIDLDEFEKPLSLSIDFNLPQRHFDFFVNYNTFYESKFLFLICLKHYIWHTKFDENCFEVIDRLP